MLLPLLGVCAVVGPFQGSEWEPIRDLLSPDQSCRDPRCCGNLLVFCLFLIWQVQQYWHQITRTSRRKVKVPPKSWLVPSAKRETFFKPTSKFFFTPGKIRGLDVHVRQCARNQRWEYRRDLQQPWAAQHLLSPWNPSQDLSWDVHAPSDPIFCASSFSSTYLLPQDSSWEVWQVPWSINDRHAHPSLGTCQRMEQLQASSQEKCVPVEPVGMRYHSTSTALTISLPDLPSVHRPKLCLEEMLLEPSEQLEVPTWDSWDSTSTALKISLPDLLSVHRPQLCLEERLPSDQLEMPTWGSRDSPKEPLAPRSEIRAVEYSEETQAPQCINQIDAVREDAWETQASRAHVSTSCPVEDGAEVKGLRGKKQIIIPNETDGEIQAPVRANQDRVRVEIRTQTEKLWKTQREAGNKTLFPQAHMGANQEQLRCKTEIAIQTPEWKNQGDPIETQEDPIETQALEKEEKEARGEGQAEGLETQGWIGGEKNGVFQMLEVGTQDQTGDSCAAKIKVKEERNKSQSRGRDNARIQTSGSENLGEAKQQAREWEKQGRLGSENEPQIPAGEQQGQRGSEKARTTQASKRKNQNLSRHKVPTGMRTRREIREEDWVVIRAPWWETQSQRVHKVDRELKVPRWRNQNQVAAEHNAGIEVPEEGNQRKDREENGSSILTPKVENQRQLRGKIGVEVCTAGRKNKVPTREENGPDFWMPGKRNLRWVKGEDDIQTQKFWEEHQGQLGNEFYGRVYITKWKNRHHARGSDGTNTQASDADNWEVLIGSLDGKTRTALWRKAKQAGEEDGTETQTPGARGWREAGGVECTGTEAAMQEGQGWLRSGMGVKNHLSEWRNQKLIGENGIFIHAPEKRNQSGPGDEDDVKTQRPERKNQGQMDRVTGGCHSPKRRSWQQAGGEKNASKNQTPEKRNWRESGSDDGRKIQRLMRKTQRPLNKVSREVCSSKWDQPQSGGEDDAKIQIQRMRNQRKPVSDDGPEAWASDGDNQGQGKCETDGGVQTARPGTQNKRGDEDGAEIQGAGSWRKCLVQSPAYGPQRHKRTGVVERVDLAPCPEMKPGPHFGEVFLLVAREKEHLVSRGPVAAQKHRVGFSPTSQQAQPGSSRKPPRDKGGGPGKASSLAWQHWCPPSQVPPVCPALPRGQIPQAATSLAGAPAALGILPKWPALKESKRLLLESLMKRRIAHLRWGLPRRILESYLVFHFLGSCSLPLAGAKLWAFRSEQDLQKHQKGHCEAQDPPRGLKSLERPQSLSALKTKSSKLATQAVALEKCRPHRSGPGGSSVAPVKPRRSRPPGGARAPQMQEEAPGATSPVARNPRPAVESRSWSGPGQIQESSSENSRGRKMVRPGVSQTAERASSRVGVSSTDGHNSWKRERTPWGPSEVPRLRCQQLMHWESGILEPSESRRAWQEGSCCSTHAHSDADRPSLTFPGRPSHSVPNLTLSNPVLLPKKGDSLPGKESLRVCATLKRELQPPGDCCAGAALPRAEGLQGQGTSRDPSEVPQDPAIPSKLGLMKHLKCFLRKHGLKK